MSPQHARSLIWQLAVAGLVALAAGLALATLTWPETNEAMEAASGPSAPWLNPVIGLGLAGVGGTAAWIGLTGLGVILGVRASRQEGEQA
ncbi:hypothetical protein [Nocardioides gilvus]|uniref:hypothetical protein n=1 Tax=Nocardioides gilvus TaxID=1735589 RepID=UPI000D74CA67|nr:hypothetical protein [Nocardioides gilvus]